MSEIQLWREMNKEKNKFWTVGIFIANSWGHRVLYIKPNAGPNSHFQRFLCKKAKKKQEICSKILQKTHFFKFAPECW